MDYHSRIRAHLSSYKEFHLGIRSGPAGSGSLLPDEYSDLNILPRYRRPFRRISAANPMVRLQPDFRDLLSSQALCFNLFIPFVQETERAAYLLDGLGLDRQHLTATGFDFSFDDGADDVFDFHCTLEDGGQLYFDVKLAETWFGPSHRSGVSSEALLAASRREITGLVAGRILKSPEVAKVIVLLQKLAWVSGQADATLVSIFPASNQRLTAAMQLLQDNLYRTVRDRLKVVYLEDLLESLAHCDDSGLAAYFQGVQRKYVPAADKGPARL